jgi:hypothetical protein
LLKLSLPMELLELKVWIYKGELMAKDVEKEKKKG